MFESLSDRLGSILNGLTGRGALSEADVSAALREVRRALYLMGRQLFKDRVSLGWADDRRGHNAFQWRAMLAMADSWEKPELPLTGEMIKVDNGQKGCSFQHASNVTKVGAQSTQLCLCM